MRHKSELLMKEILEYTESFYIKNFRTPYTSEIASFLGISKSTVYKYLVDMDNRGMLSYQKGNIVTEKIRKVDTDSIVAAVLHDSTEGIPPITQENVESYINLPVCLLGKGEFFIVRMKKDSMVDVGIERGDVVVIRKQTQANEGDIVAALYDHETILKRFHKDGETRQIRLHPDNQKMKDIILKECSIQGVAVYVIKALTKNGFVTARQKHSETFLDQEE